MKISRVIIERDNDKIMRYETLRRRDKGDFRPTTLDEDTISIGAISDVTIAVGGNKFQRDLRAKIGLAVAKAVSGGMTRCNRLQQNRTECECNANISR